MFSPVHRLRGPTHLTAARPEVGSAPDWHKLSMRTLRDRLRKEGGQVKLTVVGPKGERWPLQIPPNGEMTPNLSTLRDERGIKAKDVAESAGWTTSRAADRATQSKTSAARMNFGDITRYLAALGLYLEAEFQHPQQAEPEVIKWSQLPADLGRTWVERELRFKEGDTLLLATQPQSFYPLEKVRRQKQGMRVASFKLDKSPAHSAEWVKRIETHDLTVPVRMFLAYATQLNQSPRAHDRILLELHIVDGAGDRYALHFAGNGVTESAGLRKLREFFRMPDGVFEQRLKGLGWSAATVDARIASGEVTFGQVEQIVGAFNAKPQWVLKMPYESVGILAPEVSQQ